MGISTAAQIYHAFSRMLKEECVNKHVSLQSIAETARLGQKADRVFIGYAEISLTQFIKIAESLQISYIHLIKCLENRITKTDEHLERHQNHYTPSTKLLYDEIIQSLKGEISYSGLTITTIASALKIDKSSLSRYLSGKIPIPLHIAVQVCMTTGVKLSLVFELSTLRKILVEGCRK